MIVKHQKITKFMEVETKERKLLAEQKKIYKISSKLIPQAQIWLQSRSLNAVATRRWDYESEEIDINNYSLTHCTRVIWLCLKVSQNICSFCAFQLIKVYELTHSECGMCVGVFWYKPFVFRLCAKWH